ncbi:MAG TPA: prepilin-type N-terminal cleavage/methylation domain-containing protein, partial [Terriglobales bacterium]|nr:prepilin-type N-terminal cleavage/methylation domain-containing protein [Terriglobales bacterium]
IDMNIGTPNMKTQGQTALRSQAGFSLLELVVVCAILTIVLAAVFNGINLVTQRSHAEQTKVDLTQEGREFVDEFERDLHQAGYPNCRMVKAAGAANNCPADYSNTTVWTSSAVAAGLVKLTNTEIVFEGDVDGGGTVDSIRYRLLDSAGNSPPTGTCPCTIQRSQIQKVDGTAPLSQGTSWSQELQNVVNSGVPGVDGSGNPLPYGGGLSISGSTAWGATNTAYYAAITSFKDFPVFQAYDQFGNIVSLPQDITSASGSAILNCGTSSTSCVKSIRLTINLLANGTTGVDMKTRVRPVMTLVGNARLVNN